MNIEEADVKAVTEIKKILDFYSKDGIILPVEIDEIYCSIFNYLVAKDSTSGIIIGCIAVNIISPNLAEVRSLGVLPEWHNKSIGSKLLTAAENKVKSAGINRIFVLTYSIGFFKKHNYREQQKSKMPSKIWKDCINCSKFPDCDEVLLEKQI